MSSRARRGCSIRICRRMAGRWRACRIGRDNAISYWSGCLPRPLPEESRTRRLKSTRWSPNRHALQRAEVVARRKHHRRRTSPARRDAGDRARRRRHQGHARARRRREHAVHHAGLAPDGDAIVSAAAPRDETFNLVEIAIDGSGSASTDAQHRRRDVARRVTRRSDDRVCRVHDGGRRDFFDAVSAVNIRHHICVGLAGPRGAGSARGRHTGRLRRQRSSPADRRTTPRSARSNRRRGRPIVGDRGPAGDVSAPRWTASTFSVTTLTRRARPGSYRDRSMRRHRARRRPTGRCTTPTIAGVPASTSRIERPSFFAGPATDAGTPTAATLRERLIEGGLVFPIRHGRAVARRAAVDYPRSR